MQSYYCSRFAIIVSVHCDGANASATHILSKGGISFALHASIKYERTSKSKSLT